MAPPRSPRVRDRAGGSGRSSARGSDRQDAASSPTRTSATPAADDAAAAPTTESAPEGGFMYTGDIDNVWSHGIHQGQQGFKCLYCGREYCGGGATRLTEHLAWVGKNIRHCDRVPPEVRAVMRKSRLDKLEYKREEDERRLRIERELVQEARGNHVIDVDAVDMQTQIAISRLMKELDLRREVDRNAGRNSGSSTASHCGKSGPIEKYLRRKNTADKSTVVSEGYQERIDVAFDKTKVARIGEAWARFFHANAIPGRKADCPYFRAALLLSMELGVVHPLPKGSDIDGKYLTANRMELEEYVMQFKDDWKQFGVTIMCDSWTGPTSMSIINFMVYCNEKMLFHKSVNASGKIQNADFLYLEIKKVIVDEIGHEVVMQIVTDNGSNYKKACALLIAEYPHIYWQPCAAHTINLMLKDIAKFPDVAKVVKSAKKICRFLHSHNRLHEEMRAKVGGELIRPNATRFGTVFIFLQSFFDKKDKFREWMVSALWKNSEWNTEPRFDYVENCITSSQWWSNLKGVIDAVEPLYKVLRYADQQKHGTVAGFQLRMAHALHLMEAYLGPGTEEFNKYMSKVIPRVQYLYTDTLMEAAAVLDPEGHYKFKSSQAVNAADKLKRVIAQLADSSEEAMVAMKQFLDFRANKGTFNGTMARLAASNTSPSDWWLLYGGEVPILQKYALRIVSQCVSSSGCERNWSTFALIHTKLRNRLGYEKLNDLVYVNYNLRLRIQQKDIDRQERELDPVSIMMDVALFDEDNPIMEWLNNSMSESSPLLDEEDEPSQLVVNEINRQRAIRRLGHVGRKRKRRRTKKLSLLAKNTSPGKGKKAVTEDDDDYEDDFADSDDSDDEDDDNEENEGLEMNSTEDDVDGDNEEENEDEEMYLHEENRSVEGGRHVGEEDNQQTEVVNRRISKRGNVPRKDPNSVYY